MESPLEEGNGIMPSRAAWIRAAIEARGMSPRQASTAWGLDRETIPAVLDRGAKPTAKVINILIRRLDPPLAYMRAWFPDQMEMLGLDDDSVLGFFREVRRLFWASPHTHASLAAALGVSEGCLRRWFRGEYPSDAETYDALARELGAASDRPDAWRAEQADREEARVAAARPQVVEEGTCGCGCGMPVGPRVQFAPGHHARVAQRGSGGHPQRVRELPLCECGCDEPVIDPRKRFLHGHHMKTAEYKLQNHRRLGMAVRRKCAICKREYRVFPSEKDTWNGCSRVCVEAARRKARELTGKNTLQQRILDFIKADETRMTLKDFVRKAFPPEDVGRRYSNLQSWFRHGGTTSSDLIAGVAAALDMPYEEALREAGGRTSLDVHRERGHALAAEYGVEAGTEEARELARKGGQAKKPPMSEATKEKIVKSREASGGDERSNAALTEYNQSKRGKIVSALLGRLSGKPNPTPAELKEWMRVTAERFKEPVGVVRAYWDPYLRERKLVSRRGRPPKIDCQLVHEWRTDDLPVKWEVIGLRLGRDPEVVRKVYARWRGGQPGTGPKTGTNSRHG